MQHLARERHHGATPGEFSVSEHLADDVARGRQAKLGLFPRRRGNRLARRGQNGQRLLPALFAAADRLDLKHLDAVRPEVEPHRLNL